ncbi:hypothetical protein [Myroides marinus]|uniref:hypothetical protein n=1 Tax=Myroides marinus TaxID=703342 RepID=UPI001428C6F8|nr:hypothetical protein [Myroides marinus]
MKFKTKPHTIPRTLNNENIGFDICDSCNSFFGTDNNGSIVSYSLDKISKEFFNVHKFLLTNKNSESWKEFKSQFFNYYHKSGKLKIKVDYIRNPSYANEFTRKFKRGIYNMFLQEYHRITENGLDEKFNKIREFVRNNNGDIPLYYLVSNNGIRLTENIDEPLEIHFNDLSLKIIDNYGYYHFTMTGLNFYLFVTDKAYENIDFIEKEANKLIGSGFVFIDFIELKRINQIDFTLNNWGI